MAVEETREDYFALHVDDSVSLREVGTLPNGDNNSVVDGDAPIYNSS
jgi:hypothetical protein